MVEISEDIFYQVKRQILEKIDIILQKLNLEIIEYLKPHLEEFHFIQLSEFEPEITSLFTYLDRLYTSLESSIETSSAYISNSYNSNVEILKEEVIRLNQENIALREGLEQTPTPRLNNEQPQFGVNSADDLVSLRQNSVKISKNVKKLSQDQRMLTQYINKKLKQFRFFILSTKIQAISTVKSVILARDDSLQIENVMLKNNQQASFKSKKSKTNSRQDSHQCIDPSLLSKVNQILEIC